MGQTFSELKRRTLLGMTNLDPKAKATSTSAVGTITTGGKPLPEEVMLVVEQAVNDAILTLCSLVDLPDIFVTDTANAETVHAQKTYLLTTDLLLTRPKDIFSVRLINDTASANLKYVPHKEWDEANPYPEGTAEGTPSKYTLVGNSMELFRVPDDVYPLYIRYNQWPVALVEDADVCVLDNMDIQIVFLAKDIANAYMNGGYLDFTARAKEYLKLGRTVAQREPNLRLKANPFNPTANYTPTGEYWNDPLFKG